MMAEAASEFQPRNSIDFVESSVLDTIVSHATEFSIDENLNGSAEKLDNGDDSPLSAIAQRKFLFFGKCLLLNSKSSLYLTHS